MDPQLTRRRYQAMAVGALVVMVAGIGRLAHDGDAVGAVLACGGAVMLATAAALWWSR